MNILRRQSPAEKFFARVDDDLTPCNVQARDVKRLLISNAHALALTDCVVRHAVMMSQNFSARVDNFTCLQSFSVGLACGNETFVVVIGHETNFLTVGLFGDGQIFFCGKAARR